MSATTPTLGLVLYDSSTDQVVTFATFRAVWGGTATTSNFYKIDTWAGTINSSISTLQSQRGAIVVSASYISANYYEATVSSITSYTTGMAILLKLDTDSSGTVTLNISSLGTKSVTKINSSGTVVNIASGELQSGRYYLFTYDGTQWIWANATSSDQIYVVSGTSGNFLRVASDGSIQDSGQDASDFATAAQALTDGDKGDITVSGGGATWSIDNNVVTFSKIQDITDNRLMGRSAGSSGDMQEITVGSGLSLSGGSLVSTGGGGDLYNYLTNGGFDIAQKQPPATLTTITDGKISADVWRVTRENADIQYQRNDATGETGLTSEKYGKYKKITNAGKFLIYQIIEGVDSVSMRGKNIIFCAKLKTDSARTFRMAILELQNAGTINAVPSALVTSWNADSTDPTFGTNVAIITAAQSKSVTTSWAEYTVSVTVPSNSKNIIVAVWSDSDVAANGTLDVAEGGLYLGSSASTWKPRLFQQEVSLCERWIEKNVAIDQAPVDNYGGAEQIVAFALGTTNAYGVTQFRTRKYSTPAVTYFNTGATAGKWKYIITAGSPVEGDVATNVVTTTSLSPYVSGTYSANLGVFLEGGWLVDCSL